MYKKLIFLSFFLFPLSVSALTISVTADPNGSVSYAGSTGGNVSGTYVSGTRPFIRAIPATGYTFAGWTGTLSGSSASYNSVSTVNISTLATFSVAPASIMTINNKCVSRVLKYNVSTARPASALSSVNVSYVQIYVMEGSTFNFAVQDVSGYLASSPNSPFYFAYNATTVGAGTYLGSNGAFAGNTSYLSIGSATLTSDVNYSCTSNPLATYQVKFTHNLPVGISAVLLGAGTYKAHSKVILTAPSFSSYYIDAFTGVCGNTAILSTRSYNANGYTYSIDDLTGNCDIQAHYVYIPPAVGKIYRLSLSTIDTPHGSYTVNGTNAYNYQGSFYQNTSLTVTAVPDAGYVFAGWNDYFYGRDSSFTYSIDRDIASGANFIVATTSATSGNHSTVYDVTLIASPNNGAGFMTNTVPSSYTFPSTLNTALPYNSPFFNDTVIYLPVVFANDGYVFKGWTGNLPTSTINKINTSQAVFPYEWKNVTNPTLIANFDYTGASNSNVAVAFTDVVSQSPAAIFDSQLTAPRFKLVCDAFYCHSDSAPSPYIVDSKCVSLVVTFKGSRIRQSGLGIFENNDGLHTYRLYALDGATFDYSQDSAYLYSFKSNPSQFVLQVDGKELPSGSYSTDPNYGGTLYNTPFSGASNLYQFRGVVPLDIQGYSCTAGQANTSSVSPFYIASAPTSAFVDGYSYLPFFGSSFVNVSAFDFSSSSMVTYGINNSAIGWNFRRMACTLFTVFIGFANNNVYCATKLSNNMPDYTKFSYMWVFTTEPIKAFYHQQSTDLNVDVDSQRTGLMVYKSDQSIQINASSTYITSVNSYNNITLGTYYSNQKALGVDNIPFYATRINLNTCDYYISARSFKNGDAPISCLDMLTVRDSSNSSLQGTSALYGEAGFVNAINPTRNNGYFIDASSTNFTARDVLFYGALLTSNGKFTVRPTDDPHTVLIKLLNFVSNPDDVNQDIVQGVASTTDNDLYIATSTTDGFYTYIATSTTYSTTTSQRISTSTLASYWKLDSGGLTTDSHGSNTLTNNNTVGSGPAFLGTGSADLGTANTNKNLTKNTASSVTGTTESVVFAIKLRTEITSGTQYFWTHGPNANNNFFIKYDYNGGTRRITVVNHSAGNAFYETTPYNVTLGTTTTHVIGMTRTTGTSGLILYLDGVQVGTGDGATGSSGGIRVNTTIGSYDDSGQGSPTYSGYTSAYIDDVSLFSSVLSTTSMSYLWDNGNGLIYPFTYSTTTASTTNGYYQYTATSTTNGYWTSTSTLWYTPDASSTYKFSNTGKLYRFSLDSYSALLDTTIGVNSLASFTNDINSRYSISLCYTSAVDFFDVDVIFCTARNLFVKFIIFLFIPDGNQMKYFSDGLSNQIETNGSPVSLAFSVPLRFANYGNLAWNPNTTSSPELSLQFTSSTSSRVVFAPATTNQVALFTSSDYSIYSFIDPILSMILSVIVSMALFSIFL